MAFLTDGFKSIILVDTFGGKPLRLKEKEVQPPEMDGGGPIDTVTMRNMILRTSAPKSLISFGDMTIQANYDPAVYSDIIAMINKNTLFTVFFSDGTRVGFYGWIGKFTPAALKEGDFPLAEVKFHCSNVNLAGDETLPVWAPPSPTVIEFTGDGADLPRGASDIFNFGDMDGDIPGGAFDRFDSTGAGIASGGGEGGSGSLSTGAPNFIGD